MAPNDSHTAYKINTELNKNAGDYRIVSSNDFSNILYLVI